MSRLSSAIARVLFYPTILWNLGYHRGIRRRRWWDEIDESIVLGALPWPRHVKRLADLGVRASVNTTAEYAGPLAEYEKHGIEQLRVPTIDYEVPTFESVKESLDFIKKHVDAGHRVYVHCKAGRARSATVVMCWLIAEKGMSPEDALKLLLERRPQVLPSIAKREVVTRMAELAAATQAVAGDADGGAGAG